MDVRRTIPLAGIVLAGVTFLALLLLGLDFPIALAVLIVWVGSLLLASGKPPDPPAKVVEHRFSHDSMRLLIENSSTPLLVTEKNKVTMANRPARRILGQHILGQDPRMAFRHPEAISLLAQNRNGKTIVRGLVRRQDIWQVNRQSVDEDFAVIELINQTAEADMSRAHTDFVANASHELRTPLASIIGYVETLSEGGDSLDSPTSRKFLDIIQREAQRLQSLISDLMSLSRVEAEKHDRPEQVLELKRLTERAARDAAGPERLDRLKLDLLEDPRVQGDRQQLEQAVRNLVDNALKYGSPEESVQVKLDLAREGMARLIVSDSGEGIAPEQIPHLTRRFYRTDPGRSRASGGTGLGLAIVKHIVERHHGRLDIESQLGRGTDVTVRLPIYDPDQSTVIDDGDTHARGEEEKGYPEDSPMLS